MLAGDEMKKQIYLIIIFQLIILQNLNCYDANADSTETTAEDSSSKELDLILVGGGGIAYFGEYIKDYFNISPAVNLGLEIPFTDSHIFSFELSSHSWIARSKKDIKENDFIDENYIRLEQNLYTQIGVSGVIKYYMARPKNSIVRFYMQFGGCTGSKGYGSLVIGTGINWKLNEYLRLQIDYKFLFDFPNLAETTTTTAPSLLMLNICYNFKW